MKKTKIKKVKAWAVVREYLNTLIEAYPKKSDAEEAIEITDNMGCLPRRVVDLLFLKNGVKK